MSMDIRYENDKFYGGISVTCSRFVMSIYENTDDIGEIVYKSSLHGQVHDLWINANVGSVAESVYCSLGYLMLLQHELKQEYKPVLPGIPSFIRVLKSKISLSESELNYIRNNQTIIENLTGICDSFIVLNCDLKVHKEFLK